MNEPRSSERPETLPSVPVPGATPDCHPLTVWLQVCAGTLAHQDSMNHLQHAAECPHCSHLLAEAIAGLSNDDTTPEEEALLASLSTASLPGQFHLAARMRDAAGGKPAGVASPRSRSFRLSLLVSLAAAACIIVAVSLYVLHAPSSATLLARAYDEQRPSALRLPGTRPGPLASVTRGDSAVAPSSDLLELELRTQKDFEAHPNDPEVRQMLGRIALVQHQAETALRNFEMAQALDPALPDLLFDMASAHFQLAESTGRSSEYGRAADLFRQFLASHASDPVALFDEALCWERQGADTEATASFHAALAAEKDPKWRQEIQTHLAKLQQGAAQLSPAALRERLTPAAFLASTQDPAGHFELLLGIASREWLPQRGADPQIEQALRKLATVGLAHNDHWIDDMLRVPVTQQEGIADRTLSNALTASSQGNADQALAQSKQAMLLYRSLGNRAGYLRAAAEHLYTLQRMGLNEDCLREAAVLARDPQIPRYTWLRIYLQLETSAAHAMLGDAITGRSLASASAVSATRDGFPHSFLRATSFVVNDDVSLQHYASAWDEATAGLRATEAVDGAAMPRFQLLSGLTATAHVLNLRWTQSGLAAAAAAAATSTSNRQTAAYAMEELALDDLQIADIPGAARSFHEADRLLDSLGDGPAKRRYAADWKTDRVLLTARTLGPAAAVRDLARDEPDYHNVDAALPRLHFYTVYADLLRQAHDTPSSMREALVAISDAERGLADFHGPADRQGWPAETRRAYEILVADLAQQIQDPALSLRAWEWLQSAPSREGRAFAADLSPQQLDRILPSIPPEPPGHLTLVVAKVLNSYIVWSIAPDPQHPITSLTVAATPDTVAHRSAVFLRLCSDPRSSREDIDTLSQALFRDLLAPFSDQIAHATQLDLDLDESLAQLPISALEQRGHYIGLEHPLKLLPAGWPADLTHGRPVGDPERLSGTTPFVVLKQTSGRGQPFIPSDYDESGDIVRLFPHAQLRSATLMRSGPELSLSGSPDLSTLLSHAVVLHYVGHGLEDYPHPATTPDPVLRLSRQSLAHCRLAVLAACQTFREREDSAEDVPSFARIVMAAGAAHVLATQWDVDSRMTSQLMQHFYAGLAQHQTFSEALRRAQQSLQSDPASAHPYFWSGFQLVGD